MKENDNISFLLNPLQQVIINLKETYNTFLFSGLLTIVIALSYATMSFDTIGIIDTIYLYSIPLYYYTLVLLIPIFCSVLHIWRAGVYLSLSLKSILDLFLLTNLAVFKVYNFHIDIVFLEMVIKDFKGFGFSFGALLLAGVVTAIVFVFNFFPILINNKDRKTLLINMLALAIFIINQTIHAVAFYYNTTNITSHTPVFPYYYPTTSHGLVSDISEVIPNIDYQTNTDNIGFNLDYPKKELKFKDVADRKNILLVVLESWRFDSLTPDVMPNMYQFSKLATNYTNHYSSGNVTVSGLFGLFSGLHPTYLTYAQSQPLQNQSLLTRRLGELNYDIDIYTSTNLERFNLKPIFFGEINDDNYHYIDEGRPFENDKALNETLISSLSEQSIAPWFKFIFYNSSHSFYDYPKNNEKYTPVAGNESAFLNNNKESIAAVFNKYKNSLHYIDTLFESIENKLRETGQLENTVIIITGDHAEEFNDNKVGHWGHGSNYSKYQSKVPLIIYHPKNKSQSEEAKTTTHVDIAPTLLKNYLGVQDDVNSFSSGIDILDTNKPDDKRSFIITSYKDTGYFIENKIYSNGVIYSHYNVDSVMRKISEVDTQAILKLKQESIEFISTP
ncbi:sulfatase-like hydrolase/transferase [Photobacterium kagoshimensis]|uniref:sulfatase-like hydrolase/transferase n=1 Tax=Photobacterium kagoshimensis TaxID=2910242 RepID=UPI003D0E18C2